MSHDNSQVYRTSSSRVGKMMIIMLGICLVGGVIFFSMWDYWISTPPPVVAMMAGDSGATGTAAHTGATIMTSLSFIESSDFRTLAFNALPGEPDNNPTVNMNVGDKVVFDVVNDGKSFHSFGVTSNDEGFGGIITGSEVALASNPLKPGEGGTSEFVAGEEGIYYYICTVPGHRDQGMVGQIIVGDVVAPEPVVEAAPEPVVEAAPEPVVEAAPEPVVEAAPEPTTSADYTEVTITTGPVALSAPGCEETDECYTPSTTTVDVGGVVTMTNIDSTGIHTFTSGTVDGFTPSPDSTFDSGILNADQSFEWIPETSGEYPYYCMLHTWMQGSVTVN
jgi:plastocyanin